MTFYFTHSDTDVDSSAVYEAYYDEQSKELAVVLESGHVYVYSKVPFDVYEQLVDNVSPGRFFATFVKRNYGPATDSAHVGFDNTNEFVEREKISVSPGQYYAAAVGTPKGLDFSKVPNSTTTGGLVTLTVPSEAPKADLDRLHTVRFVVDGGNTLKSYSVKTDSVDSAVEALSEVASALDLTLTVKEVVVSFE